MRLLIIGAGAVGTFVGARLAYAGHSVCLVGRLSLLDAVRTSGLTLIEPDALPRLTSPQCVTELAAAFAGAATYDLALLTVKAYDTDSVIHEFRAAGVTVPPILTLQNGVGNEEALVDAFGAGRVLSGAIDTPVSIPQPGQVQAHKARYGVGLATLGDHTMLEETAAALTDAGFMVRQYDDYRGLKWTKLLMNILANAQCRDPGVDPRTGDARPGCCGAGSPRLAGSGRRDALFGHRARAVGGVSIPAYHAAGRAIALGLGCARVAPFCVRGAWRKAALTPVGAGGGPAFRGVLAQWGRGAHRRNGRRGDPG